MLPLGLLSILLGADTVTPLQPMQWPAMETAVRWQAPWILARNAPDPQAAAIVDQYLANLAAAGLPPEAQGIWVQTGVRAIAAHQGNQALPAASLTKIATTLAALDTWPIDHRFETWVGRIGPVEDGVLQGDLVLRWNGDPYFVWEEAIALGNALQQAGIQRVTGNLVILGDFAMNFEPDPVVSGELLWQGLNADVWSTEVWSAYEAMPPETPQPQVQIDGTVVMRSPDAVSDVSAWVIRHQSLPLVALLKAMNIYSNNAMAEILARGAGGANTVAARVVAHTDIPVSEIRLINGSGLGEENQISPRAVVSMLLRVQEMLQRHDLSVSDVMPVFGQDTGTLAYRDLPPDAALKTGSLSQVSSLAGMFPTRDRGPVWFAVMNQGWDLTTLRDRQDALLAALQQHWGKAAAPTGLQSRIQMGEPPYQLGDPQRNQPY